MDEQKTNQLRFAISTLVQYAVTIECSLAHSQRMAARSMWLDGYARMHNAWPAEEILEVARRMQPKTSQVSNETDRSEMAKTEAIAFAMLDKICSDAEAKVLRQSDVSKLLKMCGVNRDV